MLEERGVVHARREQHDGRIVGAGRDGAQHLEQVLGIAFHRAHAVVGEDLGPHAFQDAAVLDHVRDARRHAQVVLEHEPGPPPVAHEVAAHDVRVDPERHIDVAELAAVPSRAEHELSRDEVGTQDALLVIDVVQEQVERPDALLEPAFDPRPFLRGHDPRDEIERHRLLGAARILVHREGDPLRLERQLGRTLALLDIRGAERRQAAGEVRVVRPHLAGGREHLVPEFPRRVRGQHARARAGGHATAAVTPSSSRTSARFVAASRPMAGPLYVPDVGETSA